MISRASGADKLRALIAQPNALVILGVQRCGNTLLARDIASLGVLGNPAEHLLKAEAAQSSRGARLAHIAAAGAAPGGDTFAMTLMINYIGRFGALLMPARLPFVPGKLPIRAVEDVVLRFFRDRFERTTFVTLRRDPLWEAAYSHWRVSVTNQYHREPGKIRYGDGKVAWREGDPIIPDPAEIVRYATKIAENHARIDAALARNAIVPLALSYREVVDGFPDYLGRVLAAAGKSETALASAHRDMKKLTPDTEVEAARIAVREFLGL